MRICARSLLRLQVPIHANVLKRSVVIASGATQSIARHNRSTDCVASLANDELSIVRHARQNKDARDKPGHDVVLADGRGSNYAWLAIVLPSAAWAAARRAIGTR